MTQAVGREAVDAKVAAFATARFGAAARVEPLAGDASDRRFFRLRVPSLSSLILMVHAAPFDLESLPFFQHARFLNGIGAPVPQIVASYPADGILVVQDLGNETLQAHLGSCGDERRRYLYLQAVRIIAQIQIEGTPAVTSDIPAGVTALDRGRLHWELGYFRENYIDRLLGSPLTPAQSATLDAWLNALARQVAGYPRVLCHRDYHSRNLMVRGDRLYMVDFQDARMGPYTYDLASLVRDAYAPLPEPLVAELVAFFRETAQVTEPEEHFRATLRRTVLQRNIKAMGTFAAQAVQHGKRFYLPYIPLMLDSVRARLKEEAEDADDASDILDLFDGPLDRKAAP